MSTRLSVTVSELRSAAAKLSNELSNYTEANSRAQTAANNLAGMWEGDAHDAFVAEQSTYAPLFQRIIEAVQGHIDFLNNAASAYEELDAANTTAING